MAIKKRNIIHNILLAIATLILIVWLYPHRRAHTYIYEEGRPWNYAQLIAPFDIPIHPDSATIVAVRDTLQSRFVPIFTLREDIADSIIARLPAHEPYRSRAAAIIRATYRQGVVDPEIYSRITSGELTAIRILEGNVLSERSTAGLISTAAAYRRLDSLLTGSEAHKYLAAADISAHFAPGYDYDADENKRHFDNEYVALTADRGVILQGQAIINKGDIISPQDFTNLRTYEQLLETHSNQGSRSGLLTVLGQTLYAGILLVLLLAYCAVSETAIFTRLRSMLFVFSLIAAMVLIAMLLSQFVIDGIYLVPVALVPVLMLVFFDGRVGLFVSTVVVLLIAPMASFTLEFVFLEFAAASTAVYTLRELSRRAQLLRTSIAIALIYVAGYLALELMMNGSLEGFTWRMTAILIFSALLTSTAYILMPPLERIFGFVSVVTLSELTDTNQPLLRQLSDKCPGTFQHSMSVSNLATDAARAMGADESLVRAGALYHDIGKMANPAFFTENQHGVNPHDTLSPAQSARIVINHVTDGLKLADREGLPAVIKAFIREHHGAGKAKYFFFQHCKDNPDGEKEAQSFTYPGPNPRSRETSLLMMADAVEAASRSLPDYSRESIAALVDKIVDGQIADGLHAESTLEFRDIPLIKNAFVKRLMTIYHTRIAYPTATK